MDTPVSDYYNGKTIFITGATGFIGKVLIEKILYSCSGVKKIFILARPKRGKSVETRLYDIWNLPMFDRLRKVQPNFSKKITCFDGDLLSENLGLSQAAMEQLHSEVQIVFNCAATLKLEAGFRDAIDMNTTGTWRVIEICRKMTKLITFVHLSTAFCYADREILDEKVYDASDDPHEVMRVTTWMTNDALDFLSPKLLRQHPNTYTYSKRLGECLIRDEYPKMPMVIARPSIVIPAWEEPVKGWVDNLNGPVGLMLGAGKGVIRSMLCDGSLEAEIVPVDYVANALIVLGYTTATVEKKPAEIPVFNITNSGAKLITWGEVLNLAREAVKKDPLDYPLWYPGGDIRTNKFIHGLCVLLFHWLPAYFIDFLLFVFRQKRFMIRIQNRISLGLELLQFFTMRQWIFPNKAFKDLYNILTPIEKKTFCMDFGIVDNKEYIRRSILGARQYCLKEPLENLPKARVVNNIMYLLDLAVKMLFYGYILWTLYSYLEPMTKYLEPNKGLKSFPISD